MPPAEGHARLTMPSKPFVIVVGSDFSKQAVRALRVAYEQARLHAPAELHVVHATILTSVGTDLGGGEAPHFVGAGSVPLLTLEELREELVKHLDAQLPQLEGFRDADVRIVAHVLLESPQFALTRLAEVLDANLIVVGSHGRHGV